MGGWGRQKGENRHQSVQGTRSQTRKPPLGSWQPTVASWEKQFCSSVGSISWSKLLEAQRFMYLYDNVVQWNDSAGEEAFCNAKKRFYAEIKGIPCDISLPDPNKYIDEVNWDSEIDPELLLDLEREPEALDVENGDENVMVGNTQENRPVLCTGWGDAPFFCAGWGNAEDEWPKDAKMFSVGNPDAAADYDTSWGSKLRQSQGSEKIIFGKALANQPVCTGWGDSEEEWPKDAHMCPIENTNIAADYESRWESKQYRSQGWNGLFYTHEDLSREDYPKVENGGYGAGENWGTWGWRNDKRGHETGGCYMSRPKSSGFRANGKQTGRGWNHRRGTRRNDYFYRE